MAAFEPALRLLRHHSVPALSRQWTEAAAEVEALERELAAAERRVTWWERAVFFRDSPDEVAVAALGERLEAARERTAGAAARRAAAILACVRESPPIEVVYRVESVIDRLLSDPELARTPKTAEVPAAELEAIAERVFELWIPGVELWDVLEALHEHAPEPGGGRAIAAPVAPARDARLGWAPVGREALVALGLRQLGASKELAAAREQLGVAQLTRERVRADLERARGEVGLFEKLTPGGSPSEWLRDQTAEALDAQEERVVAAVETVHRALVRALSAHPSVWVGLACLGAAAALRSVVARDESALDPEDGSLTRVRSAADRAVALACLAEVREACSIAFEGLQAEVWPRRADAAPPAEEIGGPFRVRRPAPRAAAALDPAAELSDESRRFFEHLARSGVRGELAWAAQHATTLGIAEHCHARQGRRIAWHDRAAFWSDTPAELAQESLSSRREFHRALMRRRAYAAMRSVEAAAALHPLLGVARSLVAAQTHMGEVRTDEGRTSSPRACEAYGRADVLAAVHAALRCLSDHYGAPLDRGTTIEALGQLLERAGPRTIEPPTRAPRDATAALTLLASRLQGTPFAASLRELSALEHQLHGARADSRAASAAVSAWDKLNVFTDSPEEQRSDAALTALDETERRVESLRQQVWALYRSALEAHPPSLLADEGQDVMAALRTISTRSVRRKIGGRRRERPGRQVQYSWTCEIDGVRAARARLDHWAEQVVLRLGALPCAGDLLDEWVASELR